MTKKQAFKSILFCLLFVCMLVPLTYMMRTNGVIKDIFTGFYAEPDDTIDVVMIGSSPVYPCLSGPQMRAVLRNILWQAMCSARKQPFIWWRRH